MDIFDRRAASPMLIAVESDPFDSTEYLFELKMDGERCLAYLGDGVTELVNRRHRRLLPQFPELATLHEQVGGRCILDGEMIVGLGGKADFESIKRRTLVKNPFTIRRLAAELPCIFVALDILYKDRELITALPLSERKKVLADTISDSTQMSVVRTVDTYGNDFFRLVREKNLEGVIAKRKGSFYRMGKRTREWAKFKNWEEADFVICGYVRKEGVAVASLVLGQYDAAKMLRYKGRVTLGLHREDFAVVEKAPKTKSPLFGEPVPRESADAVWLEPRLVCRVGFMCWTAGKRLRQPFYKQLQPNMQPYAAREPKGIVPCT